MKKEFLYGELTYKVNGILYAVHNQLGRYSREKQYADLLEAKLKENKIVYKREVIIAETGNILDFLVDDKVVLELKAKPFLSREDYFQVQRYLQASGLRLGILVNFQVKYLQPKRVLHPISNL